MKEMKRMAIQTMGREWESPIDEWALSLWRGIQWRHTDTATG